MSLTFLWVVVVLVTVTSVGIMLVRDWRSIIIFLAVQYIGMFIFTMQHWPISMSAVKVIAGWMSAAILGMTRSNLPDEDEGKQDNLPQGRLFRLLAAGIIVLIVAPSTPLVDSVMADSGIELTAGSLLLVGMGLLHLGVTDRILQVTVGLMTVLSGFEILYTAVETSVLVAALLAVINLGLAMVGSYLMVASNAQEVDIL